MADMISPLSWTPIAVALFGIGDLPVYFLIAIAAVWPVMLSTASGIEAVDRRWITSSILVDRLAYPELMAVLLLICLIGYVLDASIGSPRAVGPVAIAGPDD